MNRSESALIAKLFAGILFNDFIFERQEILRTLLAKTYQRPVIEEDATIDTSYFLKIKDMVRSKQQSDTPCSINETKCKSAYTNAHFDITTHSTLTSSTHAINKIILFELKFLSDANVPQLLHGIELMKMLNSFPLYFQGKELIFDEVYLLTITTWANLHYARAFSVDAQGIISIPGVGTLPDNVRIITFDHIAEVIIELMTNGMINREVAISVLRYMYNTADYKTLKVDGSTKGTMRSLVTDKRQIEILGIL